MEEKVGQHAVQQVGLALVGHRIAGELDVDVAILRAVDLPGFESPDVVGGLGDPGLELVDGFLIVFPRACTIGNCKTAKIQVNEIVPNAGYRGGFGQ